MGGLSGEVRTEVLCGHICDLEAENAKLREQGARLFDKTLELATDNAKLRQQLADATESMGRVEERCAALRELVKYTLLCCERDWPCEKCPLCGERGTSIDVDGREVTYTICKARDTAQGLGIEVDG